MLALTLTHACLSCVNQVKGCHLRPVRPGSRNGAVVRALASHQCGPGLISGLGVKSELSLLLVLVLTPRGSSPDLPTFPKSNSIWNLKATGLSVGRDCLN